MPHDRGSFLYVKMNDILFALPALQNTLLNNVLPSDLNSQDTTMPPGAGSIRILRIRRNPADDSIFPQPL
jgi:hypothetical protein